MSDIIVETSEIGGHEFVVKKINAEQSIRLQAEIFSILGEGVGGLVGGNLDLPDTSLNDDGELDSNSVMQWLPLVGKIMGATNPDKAMALLMRLMSMARIRVNGDGDLHTVTPQVFNRVFSGNTTDVYKLAGFVLKVQFSDFLGLLGGAMSAASVQSNKAKTKSTNAGKLPRT
jgi:hypothetical protein